MGASPTHESFIEIVLSTNRGITIEKTLHSFNNIIIMCCIDSKFEIAGSREGRERSNAWKLCSLPHFVVGATWVVCLCAADNVSRSLPSRLTRVKQPVLP